MTSFFKIPDPVLSKLYITTCSYTSRALQLSLNSKRGFTRNLKYFSEIKLIILITKKSCGKKLSSKIVRPIKMFLGIFSYFLVVRKVNAKHKIRSQFFACVFCWYNKLAYRKRLSPYFWSQYQVWPVPKMNWLLWTSICMDIMECWQKISCPLLASWLVFGV